MLMLQGHIGEQAKTGRPVKCSDCIFSISVILHVDKGKACTHKQECEQGATESGELSSQATGDH